MTKLLIATNNRHKVEEISKLFSGLSFDVMSLREIPHAPVTVEDQPALEGNALKKAREAFQASGILSLADDTGLECYYLELRPGVYSSRYAGENATYDDNNRKLLWALRGVPLRHRKARFRTVVALVGKNSEKLFEAKIEGVIAEKPRGENGFGYDPLFIPHGHKKTYAEMTLDEKNTLSHRAMALQKVIEELKRT